MEQTSFSNPNYRAEKLKQKLIKDPQVGSMIEFTVVEPAKKNTLPFQLVFSNDIETGDAIAKAYQLASKDTLKTVALRLRSDVLHAYEQLDDKEAAWPPDPNKLVVQEGVIPVLLQRFLSLILGNTEAPITTRSERIMFSIGQDICRAITNGGWKLPKHILLCTTIRHLFCSNQLITMLNRLGHCENNTFAAEMESALATSLAMSSSLLTNQIVRGPRSLLFHSEWDNFNQKLSSVHGVPICNTAGGIMMQEVSFGAEDIDDSPTSTSNTATMNDSASESTAAVNLVTYETLPDLYVKKSGPNMDIQLTDEPVEGMNAYQCGLEMYWLWVICRDICSTGKQKVPALSGFISATGTAPQNVTTIDYYPMINEPITEYKVVREILHRCEKATREVGQLYTITSFDLGVIMKAMPIIWDKPEVYRNHIILIGSFHTIMNYLNMIGHKMAGSGYSEILTEANLITSGCLNGVLSGKSYSKSLWCLKVVSECFERLLFAEFVDQLPDESPIRLTNPASVDALIQSCTQEELVATQDD